MCSRPRVKGGRWSPDCGRHTSPPAKHREKLPASVVHSRPSNLIVVLPPPFTPSPALTTRRSIQISQTSPPAATHSQPFNPIDCTANMADVATPPAAQASTNGAAAPQAKQQVVKPDKPDEDKYKEDLAKLEKEHAAAQEKLVSTCSRVMRAVARPRADGWLHRTPPTNSGKLLTTTRTPARPSLISPSPTTRTRRTQSASRSSRRSSTPSARPSRATSQDATPSSRRSRSSTSSLSSS